jgi:3-deoxy-D-manno-octulosonic-acid transferase
MIFFYKTLINIFFLFALPFLPFIYFFSKKRRATLGSRFALKTDFKSKQEEKKRVWVHALSVGEVISALPLVKELKEQYSDLDIVFTASTKTGFDMAEYLFLRNRDLKNESLINQLGYFPFDLGFCVNKISSQIDPDAVVLVETDLWPNFLYEMERRKTAVVLINARLSKRSLKGYLFFKKFSFMFFSSLTEIMAQTQLDKKRFQSLGIDKRKISVAGNIKFDQTHEDMDEKSVKEVKNSFGVQKGTKVFLAGSTHEGEEKILCNVYKKIKKKFPELLMIIAPRDPKRCSVILSYFLSHDVSAEFMSTVEKSNRRYGVVLVDRMGELSRLYAICDVAFIGGSMVRQGGHNPLEPAAFSKPVLFGVDMSDFLMISNMLMEKGGAIRVESEIQLGKEIETILENRQIQQHMGSQNFEIFSRNSGAVQRTIESMKRLNIL